MFGKIRRPKAESAPSLQVLKGLQSESDTNRGREIELMWSRPGATNSFNLSIKTSSGPVEPMWMLWQDDGHETKLIWQYQTMDTDLINDCVQMSDSPAAPSPEPLTQPGAGQSQRETQATFGQNQGSASQEQQSPYGQPLSPPPAAGRIFGDDDGFPKAPTKEQPQRSTLPPPPPVPKPNTEFEGSLDEMKSSTLIALYATNRKTGKLEIVGVESVGSIFFVDGTPKHATTPGAYGDAAIRELVTWEKGTYTFQANAHTDMRSVETRLDNIIAEGSVLLDQKRHLKRFNLSNESILLRKHKQLSETELRLMLMKGAQIDFEFQKKIYEYFKSKRTFTDLLRDHPMDSTTWTALLFNFISCGLIDIKEPNAVRSDVLDFLGADKDHVETLETSFVRPETGIYTYEALLFFLEYEYHRFEAYGYPLSIVLFEVLRKRQDGSGGTDMLTSQAANVVAERIKLIKRKLDTLGHFQTLDFALLLPNTRGSSAAWLANKIFETITATPIGKDLDRNTLHLAFGVASLPADGDDLQALINAAKKAKHEAKDGTFPVVLSRGGKK